MVWICVDSGSEDSVNGFGVQRRTKTRAKLRVQQLKMEDEIKMKFHHVNSFKRRDLESKTL